jgi:hypothetical protein
MLPAPPEPPDPPPLASLLAGLLQGAGAQAARAVEGRGGAVLAEVGLADGDDVAALVQLTRAATAAGRSRGEWLEDVVVTLGRTVHVLRECGGAVLHARLDPARGDVGAVRRALAAAEMWRAVDVALRGVAAEDDAAEDDAAEDAAAEDAAAEDAAAEDAAAGSGPDPVRSELAGVPTLPSMRPVPPQPPSAPARQLARLPEPAPLSPPPPPPLPLPLPRPRGGPEPRGQEPALVTVDGGTPVTRTGALAVLALPPIAALPQRRPAAPAPPARQPRAAIGAAVLRQPWASDVGTMRRLLVGLQRMG